MPSIAPNQQQHCFGTSTIPKPKRVTFDLSVSTRTRNAFGSDFYIQVMWMKFDGLSNEKIAAAIGCCVDTLTDTITGWQESLAAKASPGFEPLDKNPRKTRLSHSPAPKF